MESGILFVEDNSVLRKTFEKAFKSLGKGIPHTLTVAENGTIGLEYVKSKKFEIVVTDHDLGTEVNGHQIALEAHKRGMKVFINTSHPRAVADLPSSVEIWEKKMHAVEVFELIRKEIALALEDLKKVGHTI